jgi:hypothetical protein
VVALGSRGVIRPYLAARRARGGSPLKPPPRIVE